MRDAFKLLGCLRELVALELVSHDPCKDVQELQVLVAERGLRVVTAGAKGPVAMSVRENQWNRGEGANVRLLGDRQRRGAVLGARIGDEARQAAREHALAISLSNG